jgi:Tol biopolymer transport system component
VTDAERWKRVERLYHEALERKEADRQAFLESACAGDVELLEEVRSLLRYEDRAEGFLEEAAAEVEARRLAEESPESETRRSLKPGTRLGVYRIVSLLGAGGMGEVYRARDLRLGREVAVKVLPAGITDPVLVRRFQQEARAAGALNHPSILAIYDLGEEQGRPYVVSELLEGQTLRQRMRGERLPARTAVDYGLQVAQGLAAAHERGIVHRDLKPENLFVTKDGRVKILDFGLAKLTRREGMVDSSGPTTEYATESGTVLGTVGYMSPEQVRGEAVDARSDIFSLGAVLYEMLCGRRAFHRESAAETMNAILKDDPPEPSGSGQEIAPGLSRIVYRCLEKRTTDRFHSAHDLALALEAVSSGPSRSSPWLALTAASGRRRVWWLAGAAAVIAVAALGATAVLRWSRPEPPLAIHLAHAAKVTAALGIEDYPSWSPDGRTLAYQSDAAGNWDVWVTQVGTTEAVNRTADSPVDDKLPSWSPDGRWIAFFSQREGGGYFVMPAVGGTARKVVSWPVRAPSPGQAAWSPDSAQIAYALGQATRPRLEILTLSTLASRTLPLPDRPLNNAVLDLSWSPDGRWLAYVRAIGERGGTSELWVTRTSDGTSFQLTDGSSLDRSPTWSGPGGLLFVSNRGGAGDLWRYPLRGDRPQGEPQQVTTGIQMTRAAFSVDGKRLAYAVGRPVRNAFKVPLLPDRPATWADATQLTFQEAGLESLDVARDGRLLFASNRGGNWDVWMLPAGGGPPQQLTTDPSLDAGPRWKPDESEVVFYSSRSGHREIWIMPAGGGPARQVTRGESENLYPDWSPDGREIVKTGREGLSILPAQGGKERRLTDNATDDSARWSPDGRWIVFDSLRSGDRRVWRVPASGGEPERLAERLAWLPCWSRDGRQIYFVTGPEPGRNIWALDPAGGEERLVSDLAGRPGRIACPGLTTDGHFLYFPWRDPRGDIWVADVVTSPDR